MITRWISEKKNKKWLYPVESDAEGEGGITKQQTTRAKVIGVTKVNIPSPMHPIVPYYVLLLEDEHGNRMPKKSMKKWRIGDLYEIEKATNPDAVVARRIKYDTEDAVKEAIELLSDTGLSKEDKVLVKISIVEPAYAYQGIVTHPKVLDALLTYLKGKEVSDIIVAEQSTTGVKVAAVAKKAGLLAVCKKHDVSFVDLAEGEYEQKESQSMMFGVSKAALERKIINVPALKTHAIFGVAGAMENLVRVVDEPTKNMIIEQGIDKALPALNALFAETVVLGDASIGLQAQGPGSLGEPAFLNMLFASRSAQHLDMAFTQMGMLPIPGYLASVDPDGVEIVGEDKEAISFHLKRPTPEVTAHPKIKLINGNAKLQEVALAMKLAQKLFGVAGAEIALAVGGSISEEQVVNKKRIVTLGQEAADKLKELGKEPVAELKIKDDFLHNVLLVKSILEKPEKTSLNALDHMKSKIISTSAKMVGGK